MSDENLSFPFFDLANLPYPPDDYELAGKPDSEFFKHTVSELKAFLEYHGFGFNYKITKPHNKAEYVCLLKKLHYNKPRITSRKANVVSPLLCQGDIGPGTLPPFIRKQFDVPGWSLPEEDALNHFQPHEWLRNRRGKRPKAQDLIATVKENLVRTKIIGVPRISPDPRDEDNIISNSHRPLTEPDIPKASQTSPPYSALVSSQESTNGHLKDLPSPTVGGFTPINPRTQSIPGLGALGPNSPSPNSQQPQEARYRSDGQPVTSSSLEHPKAGGSKDVPPRLEPESPGTLRASAESDGISLNPSSLLVDLEFNTGSLTLPQDRTPNLRRDVTEAAERLIYGYVYHGLLRHPDAPPKPELPNKTALTSDDVRKALPAALRANSHTRIEGDPYSDRYYSLVNDPEARGLLKLNQRASVTQKEKYDIDVQALSSLTGHQRGETSVELNTNVRTKPLSSVNDRDRSAQLTPSSLALPRDYRFYGRGPCYSQNSCYLDTVITAALLLDAGMTIADRTSDHDQWYDELDRVQKEFVDSLSASWDFLSERASSARRDEVRAAYRRLRNRGLTEGNPGYLKSDGQAPVTEVWDRLLKPFGQFSFTGVKRTTFCSCKGLHDPTYSPKRLYHTMTPDHEPEDAHGIDVQALLQRCFIQRRPCRYCKQLTRSVDEIVTNRDLPIRLVMQPYRDTRITGHTSDNIKIQYYRRGGLNDSNRPEEATYRYLGGIYYIPSIGHFVLAWSPPYTSPTHHAPPCASDNEANSILLYDSMLISGSIIGVSVPRDRAERGEKVPEKYMDATPPILFYERVLDPSREVLDEVERVVKRMRFPKREKRDLLKKKTDSGDSSGKESSNIALTASKPNQLTTSGSPDGNEKKRHREEDGGMEGDSPKKAKLEQTSKSSDAAIPTTPKQPRKIALGDEGSKDAYPSSPKSKRKIPWLEHEENNNKRTPSKTSARSQKKRTSNASVSASAEPSPRQPRKRQKAESVEEIERQNRQQEEEKGMKKLKTEQIKNDTASLGSLLTQLREGERRKKDGNNRDVEDGPPEKSPSLETS